MAYSNIGVYYNLVSAMKMSDMGNWSIGEIDGMTPIERQIYLERMIEVKRQIRERSKIK